ncbi:MAG: ATP-dependent protease, partial [Pseudomonadota bacterium]
KEQLRGKSSNKSESSTEIQKRVCCARDIQLARQGKPNAYMSNKEIENFCALNNECEKLMDMAFEQLGLSARGYHRTLKLARSIADLENSDTIGTNHLSEAIGYRQYDRLINK